MKRTKVKTPLLGYRLSLSSGAVVIMMAGFDGTGMVPVGTFAAEAATKKAVKSPTVPQKTQPVKKTTVVPQKTQPVNKATLVPQNSVEPVYNVVSPLGDSTVKKSVMAPRLNTLEGKTVGMVWNHSFKADITFPAIEASLKQQYPGIKIIPYTEFDAAIRAAGDKISSPQAKTIQTMLKQKYLNAVISGNGG
jgi:hypothetical protein